MTSTQSPFSRQPNRDVAMRFKRGIDRVVHEIDQHLLDLRGVGPNRASSGRQRSCTSSRGSKFTTR